MLPPSASSSSQWQAALHDAGSQVGVLTHTLLSMHDTPRQRHKRRATAQGLCSDVPGLALHTPRPAQSSDWPLGSFVSHVGTCPGRAVCTPATPLPPVTPWSPTS